jgi:hypothetical protein
MRTEARENRRSIAILHKIERLLRDEPDDTVRLVQVFVEQLRTSRAGAVGAAPDRARPRAEEPAA